MPGGASGAAHRIPALTLVVGASGSVNARRWTTLTFRRCGTRRRRVWRDALAAGVAIELTRSNKTRVLRAGQGVRGRKRNPRTRPSGTWSFTTRTNETVSVVFGAARNTCRAPSQSLRHVMRDIATMPSHDIDLRVVRPAPSRSALAAQGEPRFEIISGYRSPESNAQHGRAPGSGVQAFAAHGRPRHRSTPAAASAPTCATSRSPRPGVASATTVARLRPHRYRPLPYLERLIERPVAGVIILRPT